MKREGGNGTGGRVTVRVVRIPYSRSYIAGPCTGLVALQRLRGRHHARHRARVVIGRILYVKLVFYCRESSLDSLPPIISYMLANGD